MSSWPDSDATTVPATDEQLKQHRKDVRMVARPRVKQSKSAEELGESCPRLDGDKQSKLLLGEETAVKQPPATKATAVKAKPAPKVDPSDKDHGQAPTKDEHTGNQTDPRVAKAVQECLSRASTADLSGQTPTRTLSTGNLSSPSTGTVPTPHTQTANANPQGTRSTTGPADPSDSENEEHEEDEEELRRTEAAVRAKRQAHARYMRFSRSLTSSLISSEILF